MWGEIKVVLDSDVGGIMPLRAHIDDAGLDLFTPVDVIILPGHTELVDTGVRMAIPSGWCGLIKSKSGLAVNHAITADIGVIDSGYTGNIKVLLTNGGNLIHRFCAGCRIAQMVIVPVNLSKLRLVEKLPATERGENGFGSTG